MTDERLPVVRVSDLERERVASTLRTAHAEGRLTLDELDERLGEAYGARTRDELELATRELPAVRTRSPTHETRFVFSLFAHAVRRGRLRVGRSLFVFSFFSDVDLDLREAAMDAEATIRVFSLFGNADVYVDEGVDADTRGAVVFGHCRDWGRDQPVPGAPHVRVRAISLFGTTDVWRVPREARGGYRELIKEIRSAQRELTA